MEIVLLNSTTQHQHTLAMFHFIYKIANISIFIVLFTKQCYRNVLRMLQINIPLKYNEIVIITLLECLHYQN